MDVSGERIKVAIAFGLQLDQVLALHDLGADLVQVLVVVMGDEIRLDLEPVVSVNDCATRAIGTSAILFSALLAHLVLAHGLGIARTRRTRVSRNFETEVVSLHDIDRRALIVALGQALLHVTTLICGNEVDASDASAWHVVEVGPVAHETTAQVRSEAVVKAVIWLILQNEHAVAGKYGAPSFVRRHDIGPFSALPVDVVVVSIVDRLHQVVLGLRAKCQKCSL